jgi:DNA-binding GntR family transcriptional regulator
MKLTLDALAQESGLSLSEARKALKKLERDGLLRATPISDSRFPVVELTDEGARIARLFGFNV